MVIASKRIVLAASFLFLLSAPSLADSLEGSTSFLCTAHLVARCTPDQECSIGPPYVLNLPPFILVDLDKKTLSTPSASLQNRTTDIDSIIRENGLILLQGNQLGRPYSWIIVEESGSVTISIIDADEGIVGFGACTPHSEN